MRVIGEGSQQGQLTQRVMNINSDSKGGGVGRLAILKEFWQFLRLRKKWWLTPIIVMLLLLGLLIFFSQSSAVAPFIYTLF
jgi:hypothetical protein